MDSDTEPRAVSSLVLELGTGTAVVDGERTELPPTEFRLLAELASRPGMAHRADELIERIWRETPGMTAQDLYSHVWRLRKLIGDDKRTKKIVGNRRGFGYLIDLHPKAVRLVEEQAEDDVDVPRKGIAGAGTQLDEDAAMERPVPPDDLGVEARDLDLGPARRARQGMLWAAAAVCVVLAGTVWADLVALRSTVAPSGPPATQPQQHGAETKETKSRNPQQRERPRGPHHKRWREGRDDQRVRVSVPPRPDEGRPQKLALPETSAEPPTSDADHEQGPAQPTPDRDRPPGERKSSPQLPPAPTRYLYHLNNPESGDHFVTTDGAVAARYEGKGYAGAAIARVYVVTQEDTKAIATNAGRAYIFATSSPRAVSPSKVVPLWYATDNEGDFFYTTSSSEATEGGWEATLIGYVRTPG